MIVLQTCAKPQNFIYGNPCVFEQGNLLFQGIGDSGQGFANGMIYCVMVNKIRDKLSSFCCKYCSSEVGPQS